MATTMVSNEQARELHVEKRRQTNAEVAALIKDIDTSKVNLKVYRGNKYLGIIFNADGTPHYKTDPDDGSTIMVKLTGDTCWQFVDAMFGAWKNAGPGAKLMCWQWSDASKMYVPSRTTYKDEVAQRPAGALDEIVERKMQKAQRTSMPGLAELSFLADKVNDIAKIVKADKENVKKGLAVFTREDRVNVLKYSILAWRGIGVDKAEALRMLNEQWPELFVKESK